MLLVRDLVLALGSAGLSSPDKDLPVLPSVPPVDPACPNASDPLVRNMMAKTTILAAAVLIRVPTTSITLASPPRYNWRFWATSPSFAPPQRTVANTRHQRPL